MVEALVSMLLLTIIALAFLPLLITGLKAATANTTVTTATQSMNEQLSPVSTRSFTCTQVNTWLNAPTPTVVDPRGTTIHLHRFSPDAAACTTGGTVTLRVAATGSADEADTDPTWSEASTIVRITGP